jgi:hypothetical protein
MANPTVTAGDVFIPTTGRVCFAAAGTALPTSTSGSLAAFAEVGYLTDAGISLTETTAAKQHVAFQNGDEVSDNETSHALEIAFACLETSDQVQNLFYSGNYDTPAGRGVIKGGQTMRGAWVIDAIQADGEVIRYCIPDGKVTARDPRTIVNGDPITYGFKLKGFADASGNKSYDYYSTAGAS